MFSSTRRSSTQVVASKSAGGGRLNINDQSRVRMPRLPSTSSVSPCAWPSARFAHDAASVMSRPPRPSRRHAAAGSSTPFRVSITLTDADGRQVNAEATIDSGNVSQACELATHDAVARWGDRR